MGATSTKLRSLSLHLLCLFAMSTGAGHILVGRMNASGCEGGRGVLCMLCGVCGCVVYVCGMCDVMFVSVVWCMWCVGVWCMCGEVHYMVWGRCDVCEGVICEYWVLWDVW